MVLGLEMTKNEAISPISLSTLLLLMLSIAVFATMVFKAITSQTETTIRFSVFLQITLGEINTYWTLMSYIPFCWIQKILELSRENTNYFKLNLCIAWTVVLNAWQIWIYILSLEAETQTVSSCDVNVSVLQRPCQYLQAKRRKQRSNFFFF